MRLSYFEILFIDVTFYLQHVQKLVLNVLITINKNEHNRDGRICFIIEPIVIHVI